jgi:phosphatidylserine decarboxylase
MTAPAPIGPRLADAVRFDGIQPGGGAGIAVERAWRPVRRAWLRIARRGYLARQAAARTGACPGCAHDPLDARDGKLDRNQCGYRFPDDAALWQPVLGLARAGLAEVVVTLAIAAVLVGIAAVVACATGVAWAWLGAVPALALAAFGLNFFRDPTRTPPPDADALISPSDGVVTAIETVDDPDFPGGRALRISVYLSPYDVHLNRAPRAARVTAIRYFPGRFVTARLEESSRVNEQLWVDLEEPDGRVIRVKQVSGALARRLVCWLAVGEQVRPGVRYGMIKYGSRADVLVTPGPDVAVTVAVGERVWAGETVMMRVGSR